MHSIQSSYMQGLSRKLFWFAVVFEVIAVLAGLTIAAAFLIEAIEAAPSRTPSLYMNAIIGSIPFVLVAITEGAKIPLTYALFNTRHVIWRALVAGTMVAVATITFETASLGFERAYSVRVVSVEVPQRKLQELDNREAEVQAKRQSLLNEHNALVAQLDDVNRREQEEIKAHTERCKAVGSACVSKGYIEEIRRNAEKQRGPIQAKIDAVDEKLDGLTPAISPAERETIVADLTQAAGDNQMYRFAARLFGKPVGEVTTDEATFVAKIWFGSVAAIIAVTGIVLAGAAVLLVRPVSQPGKLSRMLRLALLRLRKRARVEVVRPVEKLVEVEVVKEVIREVEKLVEVEVVREVPKITNRKVLVYVPAGYDPSNIDQSDVEDQIEVKLGLHGPEIVTLERRA